MICNDPKCLKTLKKTMILNHFSLLFLLQSKVSVWLVQLLHIFMYLFWYTKTQRAHINWITWEFWIHVFFFVMLKSHKTMSLNVYFSSLYSLIFFYPDLCLHNSIAIFTLCIYTAKNKFMFHCCIIHSSCYIFK